MKKILFKFFLISIFTSFCFFSIDKVHASDSENYVSLGYVQLNQLYYRANTFDSTSYVLEFNKSYHVGNVNQPFFFGIDSDYYWDTDTYIGITLPDYIYARMSFCTTGTFSAGYGAENTEDVVFIGYNNIKCSIYGGREGYLVQANYKIKARVNPITGSMNLSSWVGTILSYDNYFSVIGMDFSPLPFSRYNEFDTTNETLFKILTKLNSGIEIHDSQVSNKLDQTNKELQESNELSKQKIEQDKNQHEEIMNDDTTESSGEAESFFSGFSTNTHGLTSIITAPLELIGNIAGSTCSPLSLKVPFVKDKTLDLPCMSSIYKKHFGSFLTVYQTVTFGLVAYWVCVRIFALVKDFKNPDHDEIEVMDL